MEQIALPWGPHFYSVAELTAELRGVLAEHFTDIWVAGEISGVRLPASGHFYFTLKDHSAQIRAVCYKMTARYLKFKPQDGISVLARGRIDVYDARGEYQLIVEALEPKGYGALQLAFEQLKKRLAEEGLFDSSRKRALPPFPRRIGVVTSPSGSVIRDILQILERRAAGLHVRLFPAQVQGEGAAEQVQAGINYFSGSGWAEVVIVARGGGSLEDLWTFNEERVARAIAASSVPVISAVGHETDFTIADFVADLRAPTPSAAAEMVAPERAKVLDRIAGAERRLAHVAEMSLAFLERRLRQQGIERATATLHRSIGRRMQRVDELDYWMRDRWRTVVDARRRWLDALTARLHQLDVRWKFAAVRRRLEAADTQIAQSIRLRFSDARTRLGPLEAHLSQLSPLRILERGYAIVERDGKIVKSAKDAPEGSDLAIRLAEGSIAARVTGH